MRNGVDVRAVAAALVLLALPAAAHGKKDADGARGAIEQMEQETELRVTPPDSWVPPRAGEGGGSGAARLPEGLRIREADFAAPVPDVIMPADAITLTGKLKVRGTGDATTMTLKAGGGKTYTLKVRADKWQGLSALKNKAVAVRGTVSAASPSEFVVLGYVPLD